MTLQVGAYTFGYARLNIKYDQADLIIGKFCSLGCNITIYLGGEHHTDTVTSFPFGHTDIETFPYHGWGHPKTKGDVVLGNDVWIADGATILSGVTIGDGAVVGNSAVVSTDLPPYCIAVGNPARVVRMRFSEEIITRLLRVAWWDLTIEFIKSNMWLLCSTNVEEFLQRAEAERQKTGILLIPTSSVPLTERGIGD